LQWPADSYKLRIENCAFPGYTLHDEWLPLLNTNIIIHQLHIKTDLPTTIEECAFSSKNFQNISYLTLEDNIRELKTNCFKGLEYLNILDLIIEKNALHSVSAGILNNVPNLEILQITSGINDDILNNFLHETYMNRLLTLSINNNNLKELKSDILSGLTNMIALEAMNSGLKVVESTILESSANKIQRINFAHNYLESLPADIFNIRSHRQNFQVNLQSNTLKTLPEGIFNKAMEHSHKVTVELAYNNWHCDCALAWLHQLMVDNKILHDDPACESPQLNEGKSIKDANFSACTDTTTYPTTLSTTLSTVVTTTTDSTTSTAMETTTTDSTISSTLETTKADSTASPTTTDSTTSSAMGTTTDSTISSTEEATDDGTISTEVETSTTDTTTSPTVEINTTDSTGTYIYINCTCTTCSNDSIHILTKRNSEEHSFVSFNSIKIFNIVEDDQNKKLKVIIQANNKHRLVWMSNDGSNNIQCNYTNFMKEKRDSSNTFSAEFKTKPNTSYTVCAMSHEIIIPPPNCRAYKTLPSEGYRPWFLNNQQTMIWAVFCSALVVSLTVGGVIIYIAVRHNPRLIKGNKRVIVVGHRAGEVIVMPKEYRTNDAGFRRMSETSYYTARTSKTSYVTAIQPTQVQLIAWKFNRMWDKLMAKGGKECANKSSSSKEPPPLPPHPKDTSLKSSYEMNFPHDCSSCYTTVV
jgi:hypothetical protein